MGQLVRPWRGEGEHHRTDGASERRLSEPAAQEHVHGCEVQRPQRHHPGLVCRVGRQADRPPRPVEGRRAEHHLGVAGDVPRRKEERRTPEVAMAVLTEQPPVQVLGDVVVEPRVSRVGLHRRESGEDHLVMREQQAPDAEQHGQHDPPHARHRATALLQPVEKVDERESARDVVTRLASGSVEEVLRAS